MIPLTNKKRRVVSGPQSGGLVEDEVVSTPDGRPEEPDPRRTAGACS